MQNTYGGMDYTTYIVKPGDSLFEIAKLFNSNVNMIKEANNLLSNTIYPNQILFIPKRNSNHKNIYQTVEGDTLSTVFKKLNLDTKCLKCYAPIMDVLLVPNQVIEIVEQKGPKLNKNVIYMGEDVEEFLMNNEIDALELLKINKNNWLTPGYQVRIL